MHMLLCANTNTLMQQVMVANGEPKAGGGNGRGTGRDIGSGSGSGNRPRGTGVSVSAEGGAGVVNGAAHLVQGESQSKTARVYRPRANFRASTQPATARPSSSNSSSHGVGTNGATRPRVKT